MTSFNDRERGEEAKYAFDEETAFKIAARANRLVGEWAAGLMGLTAEEAFDYLQGLAADTGRRLLHVAEHLVETRDLPRR